MMQHLSGDDAGRWVAGVLDGAQAEALEAHVKACAACEALLQAEARIEAHLALAAGKRPVAARRWAVVSLALAASLVLLFLRGVVVASVEERDAGLQVASGLVVPRYEGELAPPDEAATARRPFDL